MKLYNLQDLLKAYGTKKALAAALGCHPAQITRWRGNLPDTRQIKVMRMLDADRGMKIKVNRIEAIRLGREAEREQGNG